MSSWKSLAVRPGLSSAAEAMWPRASSGWPSCWACLSPGWRSAPTTPTPSAARGGNGALRPLRGDARPGGGQRGDLLCRSYPCPRLRRGMPHGDMQKTIRLRRYAGQQEPRGPRPASAHRGRGRPRAGRGLHAPIGLAIGGQTAPEIALSILAEIVQLKNSRQQTEGFRPPC